VREFPAWRDLLFRVAMSLATTSATIDEALLRAYARDERATPDGCAQLTRWADGAHGLLVVAGDDDDRNLATAWRLTEGGVMHAKVRGTIRVAQGAWQGGITVVHYEGDAGNERLVRADTPAGIVAYFEGGPRSERIVRRVYPDGFIGHFEGPHTEERVVRIDHPDGRVAHFEGEHGEERKVRIDHPDGRVEHFEGE